jgi:hypothetical protein
LKHGLRAEKLALPNEDPQQAKEQALRWIAEYQPRTAHQHELVDRIAVSCTLQDRCVRFYTATVSTQVQNAQANLDRAHELEVEALQARFRQEPAAAVSGLRQSALGCRGLIGRWQHLRATLEVFGTFTIHDHEEMARLCRLDPTFEHPDPELFAIRLHSVLSRPQPEPGALDWALRSVPLELRSMYLKHWSDPAANRDELRRRIEEALVELTEREERLRTGREAVERSVAEEKALLIQDPHVAKLWIRYYTESNSAYFRASRELQRSLTEDEDTNHPEHAEHEEDEGSEASESLAEAGSPNEPNNPLESSQGVDLNESSDASAAVISEAILGSTGEPPLAPGSGEPPVTSEAVRGPVGWSTCVLPPPQALVDQPVAAPEAPTAMPSEAAPGAPKASSPNEPNSHLQPHSNSAFVNVWAAKPAPVSGPPQGPTAAARSRHVDRPKESQAKSRSAIRREARARQAERQRDPKRTEPTAQSPRSWDQTPYLHASELVPACRKMAREMRKQASLKKSKGRAR